MTSSKETKKTKILVLGSEGQLGCSLIKTLDKNFIVEGIIEEQTANHEMFFEYCSQ